MFYGNFIVLFGYSSYTNFFGNLLTVDQKRELLAEDNDADAEAFVTESPYILRTSAKSEFRNNLQSNGNYSFGGVSPFKKKTNTKPNTSMRKYTQQKLAAKKSLWSKPGGESQNNRFFA